MAEHCEQDGTIMKICDDHECRELLGFATGSQIQIKTPQFYSSYNKAHVVSDGSVYQTKDILQ